MLGRRFHSMDTIAALNTLNEMGLAGIGAGIDQIHAGLINGNGI